MENLIIIKHAPGAPGLRFFGLGPYFIPQQGLFKLIRLFNENASWAQKRSVCNTKTMLSKSKVIVSIWNHHNLIGFGRATSDETFRAVLWDIIVDKKYQNNGIGEKIVSSILRHPSIINVEKIYAMTTDCQNFYLKLSFSKEHKQSLMKLIKIV